jgi:hypothetical protein
VNSELDIPNSVTAPHPSIADTCLFYLLKTGYALRSKMSGCPDPTTGEDLEAVVRFDKFTYWNHDHQPKESDDMPQMMEWLAMSKVLHSTKPSA